MTPDARRALASLAATLRPEHDAYPDDYVMFGALSRNITIGDIRSAARAIEEDVAPTSTPSDLFIFTDERHMVFVAFPKLEMTGVVASDERSALVWLMRACQEEVARCKVNYPSVSWEAEEDLLEECIAATLNRTLTNAKIAELNEKVVSAVSDTWGLLAIYAGDFSI